MTEFSVITSVKQCQPLREMFEGLGYKDSSRKLQFFEKDKVAIPVYAIIEQQFPCSETEYSLNELTFRVTDSHKLPPSKKISLKTPQEKLLCDIKKVLEENGIPQNKSLETDIPKFWEKHGDLVLLPEQSFTSDLWKDKGVTDHLWPVVMKVLQCKRLARKSRVSDNDFRSPQVLLLVGDDGWVEHRDNKIRYTYDITRCMFSAGNITEKLRIANFDCQGETVVDLYAGIGYFTLPYLVHCGARHVYACEWNPQAVEALTRNLSLNKVEGRCTVLPGDNRQVCLSGVADRVNLGLIPSSRDGWTVACRALKPQGGILHIHQNVNSRLHTSEGQALKPQGGTLHIHQNVNSHLHMSESRGNSSLDTKTLQHGQNSSSMDTQIVQDGQNNSSMDTKTKQDGQNNSSLDTKTSKDSQNNSGKDTKTTQESQNSSSVDTKTLQEGQTNSSMDKQTTKDHHICVESSGKSKQKCLKFQKLAKRVPEWNSWADGVCKEIVARLQEIHGGSWRADVLHIEHVKSYAPHVDHLVLDLHCSPIK